MNKEEFYIKTLQPIREFCLHSDKEDVYMYIYELQQENKILRENAENNDKVVDKVNWENRLLKQQNKKYKEVIGKATKYINDEVKKEAFHHYLNDEDIQELLDILKEVE